MIRPVKKILEISQTLILSTQLESLEGVNFTTQGNRENNINYKLLFSFHYFIRKRKKKRKEIYGKL